MEKCLTILRKNNKKTKNQIENFQDFRMLRASLVCIEVNRCTYIVPINNKRDKRNASPCPDSTSSSINPTPSIKFDYYKKIIIKKNQSNPIYI